MAITLPFFTCCRLSWTAVLTSYQNSYLFTIPLTNIAVLSKAADFFLTQSNDKIPHAALRGATPLEMITGRWGDAELTELKEKIIEAKKLRCATNKAKRCGPCLA